MIQSLKQYKKLSILFCVKILTTRTEDNTRSTVQCRIIYVQNKKRTQTLRFLLLYHNLNVHLVLTDKYLSNNKPLICDLCG
jgi:hypothetical protein